MRKAQRPFRARENSIQQTAQEFHGTAATEALGYVCSGNGPTFGQFSDVDPLLQGDAAPVGSAPTDLPFQQLATHLDLDRGAARRRTFDAARSPRAEALAMVAGLGVPPADSFAAMATIMRVSIRCRCMNMPLFPPKKQNAQCCGDL